MCVKSLRTAGISGKHLPAHFRWDFTLNSLKGFLFGETANQLRLRWWGNVLN